MKKNTAFACLHDRAEIERFLRKNVYLHLYAVGDLDDFFWSYTTWYGLKQNDGLQAVALLYAAPGLPVLLAFSEEPAPMRELLAQIQYLLPPRFYTHLSPGLEKAFVDTHRLEFHGEYCKMALVDKTRLSGFRHGGEVNLGENDLAEMLHFYRESYPANWFDPRMLQTGQYFGIRENRQLAGVAGVHVYSPRGRVAALGNIATHPSLRGRGYGKTVTAACCRSLFEMVDHIGLNVKTDNAAAMACYQKLGFEVIATYYEFWIEKK